MKPVGIFRFSPTEGPGHFATFLEQSGIPYSLIRLDAGDEVPEDVSAWSGFGFMGGPMSANDELAWTQPVLRLMRTARQDNRPCIGHCLGGQLMARAWGATVTRNPVKEIGWHELEVVPGEMARHWLADLNRVFAFQWHGDTFALPPEATRILTGPACSNQAYVLGPHLGMQCHVEMTESLVRNWCHEGAPEIAAALASGMSGTVAPPERILAEMPDRLVALRALADRLYNTWIRGLAH
jgi:GMP synthase-like glutamine amidotransferase